MDVRELLVGRWHGHGHGSYPEVGGFDYLEELEFHASGRPFLMFSQCTSRADGTPLHVEVGYLRAPSPRQVELVIAQPSGVAEVLSGEVHDSVDGFSLELRSVGVVVTPTAKPVASTVRRLRLRGEVLESSFDMDAMSRGMHRHLESVLSRA
ncbi:MAG: heme-binding beta-barrel domain-containing protein [Ferrimicrobium sp.]